MSRRRALLIEQGGRGGVADYTAALAAALAQDGLAVTVLTARDHRYPEHDGVVVSGRFWYLRGTRGPAGLLRRLRLSRAVNGLAYLAVLPLVAARARRHDVVHLQGEEHPLLGLAAMRTVRATGRPVVYTPHNTFDREREVGRARAAQYAASRAIVVHARADLAELPPSARGRAHVVPHGEYGTLAATAAPTTRTAARNRFGLDQERMVALLFGQLRPDKGVGDALQAVASVPGLQLLIAGQDTGGVLEGCAAAIADPRLEGRLVVHEGFLEMDAAAAAFAAADIALLPYARASASGVVLLSWGYAVPPVAYPVGGLAEVIDPDQTGWLTAAPAPDALAERLADVVAAGPGACAERGRRGREVMHERFGWPEVARRTEELYDGVAGRQRRGARPRRPGAR